jgi:uncharacterized protein YoaH (UPF0181 family)
MLCQRLAQLHAKPLSRQAALGRLGAVYVSKAKTRFSSVAAAAQQTQGTEGHGGSGRDAQHIDSKAVTATHQGQIQPWVERVQQLVPKAVAVGAAVALASLLVPHVAHAASAAAAGQEDSLVKSECGYLGPTS